MNIKPTNISDEKKTRIFEESLKNQTPYIEKEPVKIQPVDRWINVDEALPEIERRVLVYYPDWVNMDEEYQVAHLEETHGAGIQFVTYDGVRLPTVTHWRPLPEPPKEVEEK